MVGATTTGTLFSMRRAARCDTSWTQRQSTMLGRCGPCCSVAPIGTMTMALRWASALISEALSLDHSISDIQSLPHPEEPRAAWRLEGWDQTRLLLPALRDGRCAPSSG